MRRGGQQLTDVTGLYQRKNIFRAAQTLIGIRRVALLVKLVAQREISRQTPCQIRANRRAGRASAEDGSVLDIVFFVAGLHIQLVVSLWQTPYIMVGDY